MSDDQRPSDPEVTRLDLADVGGGSSGPAQDDNSTAKCIGDFELLRELGGGMGVVAKATMRLARAVGRSRCGFRRGFAYRLLAFAIVGLPPLVQSASSWAKEFQTTERVNEFETVPGRI